MLLQVIDLAPILSGVFNILGVAFVGIIAWVGANMNKKMERIEAKLDEMNDTVITSEEKLNQVRKDHDELKEKFYKHLSYK